MDRSVNHHDEDPTASIPPDGDIDQSGFSSTSSNRTCQLGNCTAEQQSGRQVGSGKAVKPLFQPTSQPEQRASSIGNLTDYFAAKDAEREDRSTDWSQVPIRNGGILDTGRPEDQDA
jgi:hypothetical protein